MLRKIYIFLLTISFLAGMLACSTDLEVNAPYKEKKVVYCLLNPRNPYQVARISKGFLNKDRSALDIAKNSRDSILYDTNDILVELIEFFPKIAVAEKKWKMSPFTINTKETNGDFYAPDQLLYRTANIQLDTIQLADVQYKLRVTNKKTNQISEGQTELVGRNFGLFQPQFDDLSALLPRPVLFTTRFPTPIKFKRPENTSLTQCIFKWTIQVTKSNNDRTLEIWQLNSPGKMGDGENGLIITGAIGAGQFWRFLKEEIETRGNTDVVHRKFISGELLLTAASSEYKKYRDVNSNYNPVSQSTPIYTNVTNGLGVVCSINEMTYKVFIDASTQKYIQDSIPEFKFVN